MFLLFKQMSSLIIQRNKDGYIIDCKASAHGELILDIISQEPIKNYIIIQNQIYDVYYLYKYIKYKLIKDKEIATIPHNRENFTIEILEEINSKFKNKSKIIIEIIKLLKFPEETRLCLLCLKEKYRRIILEDNKIKLILLILKFDINSIIALILEFHYLLYDENISDDDIKSALEKDYRTLLLLSADKITEDIAKFVVQIEGTAIIFLQNYVITDEIIKLAVQNNGMAIKYIKLNLLTEENIRLALQNNPSAIKFLPVEIQPYFTKSL